MPNNPHYGHAPMVPVSRGGSPAGPNTTTLNDGVTGSAPATSTATGFNLFVSQVNSPGVLYLQAHSTFPAFVSISAIGTGAGTAPTVSTAPNALPPSSAPPVNNVTGAGTLTAGTYYAAYSYTTSTGQTLISPIAAVVVPANGRSIEFGPFTDPMQTYLALYLNVPRLEQWHVTRYAIHVSSATSTPVCNVYVDSTAVTSLLDTTTLGAQNSANADVVFRPGQILIAEWIGLDPNATATFSVYGDKVS